MSQIAKDYEQVSSRSGLPPGFIDTAPAAFEEMGSPEDLIDLLGRNIVACDMLNPVGCPFKVINSHRAAKFLMDGRLGF